MIVIYGKQQGAATVVFVSILGDFGIIIFFNFSFAWLEDPVEPKDCVDSSSSAHVLKAVLIPGWSQVQKWLTRCSP